MRHFISVFNKTASAFPSDEEIEHAARDLLGIVTNSAMAAGEEGWALHPKLVCHLSSTFLPVDKYKGWTFSAMIAERFKKAGYDWNPQKYVFVDVPTQIIPGGYAVVFDKHVEEDREKLDRYFGIKGETAKKCLHQKMEQTGYWDGHNDALPGAGINTGGPVAKCLVCGESLRLTWEKWQEIPQEDKRELK